MYRHEVYKIFTRKSLYVAFTLFLLFILLSLRSMIFDNSVQSDRYQQLHEEWSGPVTSEKLERAHAELEEDAELLDMGEEEFAVDYFSIEDQMLLDVYTQVIDAGSRLETLNERKEELQTEMVHFNEDTFEYNETNQNMLDNLDQPFGFYNIRTWQETIDSVNVTNVIILSIMIVLGLSTVFADEHSNKTSELILYTKHGKKKVITAKLFASITYTIALFAATNLFNIVLNLFAFGRFQDGSAPLQNFFLYLVSPYNFSLWEYYIIALTVQFIAIFALSILVLSLSVITKNALATFFISGAVLGVPFFLHQFRIEHPLVRYISDFSYYELMRVKGLFDQFQAYNLFGTLVLYPYLLIPFIFLLSVLLTFVLYHVHRRQEITF